MITKSDLEKYVVFTSSTITKDDRSVIVFKGEIPDTNFFVKCTFDPRNESSWYDYISELRMKILYQLLKDKELHEFVYKMEKRSNSLDSFLLGDSY